MSKMDKKLVKTVEAMYKQEIGSMCKQVIGKLEGDKCVIYCTPKNPDKMQMKATLSLDDILNNVHRTKLNNIKARL